MLWVIILVFSATRTHRISVNTFILILCKIIIIATGHDDYTNVCDFPLKDTKVTHFVCPPLRALVSSDVWLIQTLLKPLDKFWSASLILSIIPTNSWPSFSAALYQMFILSHNLDSQTLKFIGGFLNKLYRKNKTTS